MTSRTLVKCAIPDWIAEMFKKIDAKDLKGAAEYFADDCDSLFLPFSLPARR